MKMSREGIIILEDITTESEKMIVETKKKVAEPEKKIVEPKKKAAELEKKIVEPKKKAAEDEQSEEDEIDTSDLEELTENEEKKKKKKKNKKKVREFWKVAMIVIMIGSSGVFVHLGQRDEYPDSITIARLFSHCIIFAGAVHILLLLLKKADELKKPKCSKCHKSKEISSETIYFVMLMTAAITMVNLLPERPDMWKNMVLNEV